MISLRQVLPYNTQKKVTPMSGFLTKESMDGKKRDLMFFNCIPCHGDFAMAGYAIPIGFN